MSVTPAVSDIRLSTALRSHRKVKRLRRKLGGAGCWALACLWMFAGEQRWDGDLSGLSDDDLEEEADWDGEPGALIAGLLDCRLLVGPPGQRRIHDWAEHQPFAASRGSRIASAKKAARARWGDRGGDEGGSAEPADPSPEDNTPHAGRMRVASVPHETAMPPTQPNPTDIPIDPSHPSRACAHEDAAGGFEGPHLVVPREATAPTLPGLMAIALCRAGFQATSMNPRVIAYARAGGTVEHLEQLAANPDCAGKSAGYVLSWAMRELSEQGAAVAAGSALVATGAASPPTGRRLSKQAEGMLSLARLKTTHRSHPE